MKLTNGIYILNHALLAIVAVVLAFEWIILMRCPTL